jgi:hypothetical protein
MARKVHSGPDRLLDLLRALWPDQPRDEQLLLVVALDQDQAVVPRVRHEFREVGLRERVAEDEPRVEMLLVLGPVREERDDDVRAPALRADELLRVRLAAVELGEHLVGRVAATRAVALHLPMPS